MRDGLWILDTYGNPKANHKGCHYNTRRCVPPVGVALVAILRESRSTLSPAGPPLTTNG